MRQPDRHERRPGDARRCAFGPGVRTGISVTWSGHHQQAHDDDEEQVAAGNRIHANAYAANDPTTMGMTVAGMVMKQAVHEGLRSPFWSMTCG